MAQPTPPIKNATTYRVIYGDTDQMGVVYYANYLRWFERGRAELLRQIGLPYGLIEAQGFNFPVTEVNCHYAASARYDDVVEIETELSAIGRASLSFSYRITRAAANDLVARGATKHACVDRSGKISRIPNMLFDALQAAQR